MEIKRNEATINRPEGDRVLDAPLVYMDVPDYIRQLKAEEAWQKNDRNGITIFKTANLTLVLTALHAGAEIRDNEIDGIVTLQVLEGAVRISTAEGDMDIRERSVLALHPNIPHSIRALSDAVLLITNYEMGKNTG
jgi:quercetin dioxygenase-like cupin family protein